MAEITAALVKELRDSTGAGMMDCKMALTEVDGNIESAVDRTVDQTKAANTELVKVRAPARGCRPRLSDSRPASPSSGFLAQAEGYQKKSRKIVCCIFPFLMIVVGAIIVRLVWFGDPK